MLNPDDPDAHYDHVMATLESRDDTDSLTTALLWKLGLDDAGLTFLEATADIKSVNFGGLYSEDAEVVKHWVYAKTLDGQLRLVVQGGFYRSNPMSVRAIKEQVYYHLCNQLRCELNKKKVMKSLVVSFHPLDVGDGQTDIGEASK